MDTPDSVHRDPVKEKIMRDLKSESALIRARAQRAVMSPNFRKANYEIFDVPRKREDIITEAERRSYKQKTIDEVFAACKLYVEVKSDGVNVSDSIKEHLLTYGITVNEKLYKDTTHVVFRDGLLSTYNKAKKMGIPVVTILWIDACVQQRRLVDPAPYKIPNLEHYEQPEIFKKPKRPRKPRDKTIGASSTQILQPSTQASPPPAWFDPYSARQQASSSQTNCNDITFKEQKTDEVSGWLIDKVTKQFHEISPQVKRQTVTEHFASPLNDTIVNPPNDSVVSLDQQMPLTSTVVREARNKACAEFAEKGRRQLELNSILSPPDNVSNCSSVWTNLSAKYGDISENMTFQTPREFKNLSRLPPHRNSTAENVTVQTPREFKKPSRLPPHRNSTALTNLSSMDATLIPLFSQSNASLMYIAITGLKDMDREIIEMVSGTSN